MRIYIGTYHGSEKEMAPLTKLGYIFGPGSMHIEKPIEGDPFEVVKSIHKSSGATVKVAIGDFFIAEDGIQSVQIFVSDDWFHQR